MSTSIQDIPDEYIELGNTYSADRSKINIIKNATTELYFAYYIQLIIYYFLLVIFTYLFFPKLLKSTSFILKSIFLVFLYLFPILIQPIQYLVYYLLEQTFNSFYTNIFLSKDW